MPATRTAIICGGGVAGLSAGIALSHSGWSVDIYERSPAIREIGAGIFIKGNGLRVLESYGLTKGLRKQCVILREAHVLNKDGETLQKRILKEVNTVWNIRRDILIRVLLDRAVELGARVHIDSTVEVIAADGSAAVRGRKLCSDLIVAADGVNSVARRDLDLNRKVTLPKSGAIRLLV